MSRQTWTVVALLKWVTDHFAEHGIDSARLDAECLLAEAIGISRLELYLQHDRPVVETERARLRELVRRRTSDRVPVAQLLGRKEFWSLPLEVDASVLIPRPETETLVSAALELLPERDADVRILDVGTGSGAIALALASERPKAHVVATDASGAALEVARRNAEKLGLSERIELRAGSLFEPVASERFDLVVSNPPYIADDQADSLAPELAHEPREALFAGPDGLAVLRPLVGTVRGVLAPSAGFAVEIAPDQAEAITEACSQAGLCDVKVLPDLAGRPRVVVARAPGDA